VQLRSRRVVQLAPVTPGVRSAGSGHPRRRGPRPPRQAPRILVDQDESALSWTVLSFANRVLAIDRNRETRSPEAHERDSKDNRPALSLLGHASRGA
jgi:hypothetical protein